MQQKSFTSTVRLFSLLTFFAIALTLSACVASPPGESSSAASTSLPEEAPTAAPEAVASPVPVASEAKATQQRSVPVQLNIPELDLTLPVTPMGWRVAVVDNVETTMWVLPDASLGWQMNSAAPGEEGNMIIAGYQALGDALLAPLALDEFVLGQGVLVADDAGVTFRYQISEISDPLPVTGASEDEEAQAAAYTGLDGDARLTLITGWPDFTTTHRVFAVADLVEAGE